MAFAIAVLIGILSATNKSSAFDETSMIGSNLGVSNPVFWPALILKNFEK